MAVAVNPVPSGARLLLFLNTRVIVCYTSERGGCGRTSPGKSEIAVMATSCVGSTLLAKGRKVDLKIL